MDKLLEIIEDCHGFGNDESFMKALSNLSFDTQQFIKDHSIVKVLFTMADNCKVFAWATFHNQTLIDKGFNLRIAQGGIGVRETNQLIDLPKDSQAQFFKALNEYFGKDKQSTDIGRSAYRRHENFNFDIVRIGDGLHGKKISLNAATFQLNICNVNSDIPKYLIDRSHDSIELPHNRLTLSYDIINKALNTLDSFYYTTLAVWFFPERSAKCSKSHKSESFLKNGKGEANYQISKRRKNKALITLSDNIIQVQSIQKEINNVN